MSTKTTIMGRVGSDPDLSYLADGTALVRVSVATSGRRKNADTGRWEDVNTTWWRASAFGDLAERLAENLTKGDPVVFHGDAYASTYTGRDGTEKTSLDFKIEHGGLDWRWSPKVVRADSRAADRAAARTADRMSAAPWGRDEAQAATRGGRGVPYYSGAPAADAFPDEPPF